MKHRTSKSEQDTILSKFKADIEKDRLCILIVKDMLLTGFDAKVEDVMYLDRPFERAFTPSGNCKSQQNIR